MANKGFIKLYRSIRDCPLWVSDEPFDRRSAYIDLLLMANHAKRDLVLWDGTKEVINRGQLFTSFAKLGEHWGWSKNMVRRYINLLESTGKCHAVGHGRGTLITLTEYDFEALEGHDGETADETPVETSVGSSVETPVGTRTRMYKKNVYKNEKKNEEEANQKTPFSQNGKEYQ